MSKSKPYARVQGHSVIIDGYTMAREKGNGRTVLHCIVLGLTHFPVLVPADQCVMTKLPRRLESKIKRYAREEAARNGQERVKLHG